MRCVQQQTDIFSLMAPNQGEAQAETHTVLELRYTPEDDGPGDSQMARPLVYNESVRLAVRPTQPDFIVQKADVFCVKQFDVVRPARRPVPWERPGLACCVLCTLCG